MKILEAFPSSEEFYREYWGKAPFVVRGGVPEEVIARCIDDESLAGLSLEEDVKSRLVITAPEGGKWACEHGPFDAARYEVLGDGHWSLLVQNVEQYHVETADILPFFDFAPRWLMDDVMVSYSEEGGSVGPHIDSYHVFLVQGQGRRTWRVSDAPIRDEVYIEGQDLKVLRDGFTGQSVEVSCGDVIYIPPAFGHEGTTLETAMTFSVGFLGPKLSEMLVEYAHYLEGAGLDARYSGQGLNAKSAGAEIDARAVEQVRGDLVAALSGDGFARWMAQYFSQPTHMDADDIDGADQVLSVQAIQKALEDGEVLRLPSFIKMTVSKGDTGWYVLAVYGESYRVEAKLAQAFLEWSSVTLSDVEELADQAAAYEFLAALYNRDVLMLD